MFHGLPMFHSPQAEKCSPAVAAWAKVKCDGTASGAAAWLSHLHPSWCSTTLPAVVEDQKSNGTDFSRLAFPPLVEDRTLPTTHCCLFPLFLPALQAASGWTAGKRSGDCEQGFDRVLQNPEGGKRVGADACIGHKCPCLALISPLHLMTYHIPHGSAGGRWYELISQAPNLWQAVCRGGPAFGEVLLCVWCPRTADPCPGRIRSWQGCGLMSVFLVLVLVFF